MRTALIISLAILSFISGALPDTYKCADELEIDTCYLEKETDTEQTIYVKACKKGKKCNEDTTVGYCYKPVELLEEGDKCVLDEECITGKCSSNKCVYLADGDKCDDSAQCGIKSACRDAKCVAYVGEGEKCETEGYRPPCRRGLLCGRADNAADKTCIKQFSIENGKTVDNDYLCKSGNTDVDGKCADRSENKAEWDAYVEEYIDEQEDVLKEDKKKLSNINRYTLNSKKVAEKYVEFEYKKQIGTGDDADCIKDYFIQDELSSNSLCLSFFSLLVAVVALF